MEIKINAKDELLKRLSDLIGDLKWASTLVEDGKEIPCGRKLQGARSKMLTLVNLVKLIPDDLVVTCEAPAENVAETTN